MCQYIIIVLQSNCANLCSGRAQQVIRADACFVESMLRRTFLAILVFTLSMLVPWQSATPAQTVQTTTTDFYGGQITLPSGYRTQTVFGEDFTVYYVLPEGAQLDKTDVMLGIYVGNFPSYSPPKRGVKTKSGSFAGRRFKWQIWKTTIYRYETLVQLERGQRVRERGQWRRVQGAVWHIFVAAPDRQHIRELMQILKSYRGR